MFSDLGDRTAIASRLHITHSPAFTPVPAVAETEIPPCFVASAQQPVAKSFTHRRRDMFIDSPWKQSASSGGATGAGQPASIPLLRSFGRFADEFYKHVAPPALRLGSRIRHLFQQPVSVSENEAEVWPH